jgi:uncharacterized repeat protein (TIGR01451 family)
MFARSLHRSTDGGATWTLLRHFEGQVNSLAIDPSDGDRIYVAVYDEGLYRSENRGDSFTLVAPPGAGIWAVGVNATTVYYSTNDRRVQRSVDRGSSWTVRGQASQTLSKILVDPQNADRLFAFNGPYVLISSDGGTNWTEVQVSSAPFVWLRDIALLSATQFIASASDGIYFSSNGGASWTHSFSGEYISLAVDRNTPGRAVAARWASGNVAETTNYGVTWQNMVPWSDGRAEGIAIDSQSSSRHVLIGAQFVRHSSNLTQPWIEATQGPIAQEVNQFATTSASNAKVYALAFTGRVGGSALFTTSGDNGWQRLQLPGSGAELGQAVIAVRPGEPDRVYVGGYQQMYRSTNGGQSWQWAGAGVNDHFMNALAFDPEQTNTLYANVSSALAPASTSGIYRSTDDGATWAPWSTNLLATAYGTSLRVDPANPSRMFLSAYQFSAPNSGGLYRSNDRGVTWEQSFVGQDVRTVTVDPANSSRVYAIAANSLQVSDDGGQTFAASTSVTAAANQPVQALALDPTVPSTLYVVTSGPSSYVLRSVNSGQTWEVLRSGTEPGPWRATQLTLDPNTPSLAYVGVYGLGVASFEVAPDLRLEILGHSGRRPRGHESTFTLRAVNNGPYAATRVNVSATLPAGVTNVSYSTDRGSCSASGCVAPTLQVGEEINATVRYTTPASALSVAVSGTVGAHENDAVSGDNTAQATALTGDPGDLSVAVVPSATSLAQGGNVTYTVTVTNRGSIVSNEGNMTFTLGSGFTLGALPSGCSPSTGGASCSVGTIAVGGSQTFTFNAVATNAGAVAASANVSTHADIADTDTANNAATSSVTATAPPPPNGGNNNGGGSSSGGGGGSMNLAALIGGLLMLAGRRRFAVKP